MRQGTSLSQYYHLKAGVPQGSTLSPLLYTLFTADIPTLPHTKLLTFADDTAILSPHQDPLLASHNLQRPFNLIERWLEDWRTIVNPSKSSLVQFTLKKVPPPTIILNHYPIPVSETVRYLGLHFDNRLTWRQHTIEKRKSVNRRFQLLWKLLGKYSKLSLTNNIQSSTPPHVDIRA